MQARPFVVATGFVLTAIFAASAAPLVNLQSVSLVQPEGAGKALVAYELENEPAVVTIGIETNAVADGTGDWVALKDDETRWMSGNVNKLVQTGRHEVVWMPARSCPAFARAAPAARAVVTAWATNAPPDIMVVDLEKMNTVYYYTSMAALPETDPDYDIYKTDRVVLRRIFASNATFAMGALPQESTSADVLAHEVTLTEDFYLGVYEVTKRQYNDIGSPTSGKSYPDAYQPKTEVTYEGLRGATGEADWPSDGRRTVGASSWLKKIRDRTGVMFDLPTEAEWEYACRAGNCGGVNVEGLTPEEAGWFLQSDPVPASAQPVATRTANAWGLADMHGNVEEWCLDWYAATWPDGSAAVVTPVGATTGTERVLRGGAWSGNGGQNGRAFDRSHASPSDVARSWRGFRLWAPCVAR